MWRLGVVFAQRNAYLAKPLTLIAHIQVTSVRDKGVVFIRVDYNLRVFSAVAFPAVTNDSEGVNLRRLWTAIFGV